MTPTGESICQQHHTYYNLCGHARIIVFHSQECCQTGSKKECYATTHIQWECAEMEFEKTECPWCTGQITFNNSNIRRSDPKQDVLPGSILVSRQSTWLNKEIEQTEAKNKAGKLMGKQLPYPMTDPITDTSMFRARDTEEADDNNSQACSETPSSFKHPIGANHFSHQSVLDFFLWRKANNDPNYPFGLLTQYCQYLQMEEDKHPAQRLEKKDTNNGLNGCYLSTQSNVTSEDTKPAFNPAHKLKDDGNFEFSKQTDEIDDILKLWKKNPPPTKRRETYPYPAPRRPRLGAPIDPISVRTGNSSQSATSINTSTSPKPIAPQPRIPYNFNYPDAEEYTEGSTVSTPLSDNEDVELYLRLQTPSTRSLDSNSGEELQLGLQIPSSNSMDSNSDEDYRYHGSTAGSDDYAWSVYTASGRDYIEEQELPATTSEEKELPAATAEEERKSDPRVIFKFHPLGSETLGHAYTVCNFVLKPKSGNTQQVGEVGNEPSLSLEAVYNADGSIDMEVLVKAGTGYTVI